MIHVLLSPTSLYFLVLIPKVIMASNIKDFGSINLLGSIYKLLAKILVKKIESGDVKSYKGMLACFCGREGKF